MNKNLYIKAVAAVAAFSLSHEAFAGARCACPEKLTLGGELAQNFSGNLQLDYVTNYTFRGQVLDSNPSFVPRLGVQYNLLNNVNLVASAEQVVSTRGSGLYRSQYDVGVAVSLGNWTITPGYQVVAFPHKDGVNTQYITGQLSYNDAGFLPIALNPSLTVAKGVDPKGGTWYEAGVAPKLTSGDLSVTVPVAAGWSSNSYFAGTGDGFSYAYASAGLAGEYRVTKSLALKGSVIGYTTDSKLQNKTNNFVTTSIGLSVDF